MARPKVDVWNVCTFLGGFLIGAKSLVDSVKDTSKPPDIFTIVCMSLGAALLVFSLLYAFREHIWILWEKLTSEGEGYDIATCKDHQVDEVYAMARRLFGDAITDVNKIKTIRKKFKDGLQVAVKRDENGQAKVAGYYFMFPINQRCCGKILDFTFTVADLREEDIATRAPYGHAMYLGAIAGENWRVKAQLLGAIKASATAVSQTKSHTAYARAATHDGQRTLVANRFKPVHPLANTLDCFFAKVISPGSVTDLTAPEARRVGRKRKTF